MKKSSMLPSLAFCRLSAHSAPKYCNQFELQLRHDVMRKETVPNQSTSILFVGAGSSDDDNTHDEKQDPSMFYELMSPITSAKPDQMSASSLAYLGDVLYELFVRSRYVWPSRRMSDLQNTVVSIVRGKWKYPSCLDCLYNFGGQFINHESCEMHLAIIVSNTSNGIH